MKYLCSIRWVLFCFFILCLCKVSYGQSFAKQKERIFLDTNLIYTIKSNNIDRIKSILIENGLKERIESNFDNSNHLTISLTKKEFGLLNEEFFSYDVRQLRPEEESFLSDFFPEVNAISAAKLEYPKYFDSEPLISIKENDINPEDIDLIGRVSPSELSSGQEREHAADMGTIIAGKGNTFYSSKGIMENAHLSTTSFLNLLPDNMSYFKNNNIRIQNHSYGIEIEDYYGIEAQAYDEQVYLEPSILHIFSTGNRGGESSIFSPYSELDGYANLTGTFKHAKNVLTIGGIDSFALISAGSSIGPAYDGRIKPELVAYGYNGTSDAAAIASGCSAAIFSALKSEGFEQSSGNVKAILVAGADDLGVLGPDFQTGFGKINLLNSLKIVNDKNIFEGEIAPNEILEFEIDVVNSADVRVALTWIDPPAEIENNKALINDLDLKIIDEQGNTLFPYQIKYLPSEIESNLESSLGRDSINNIELITVFGAEGKLKIQVSGYHLETAVQSFSIAYFIDDSFEFTYPYFGAFVQSMTSFAPMWSGMYKQKVNYLEFEGFTVFDPFLIEDRQIFPDTTAKVRGIAFTNNENSAQVEFIVSEIPKIEVGWACGDSVLITWDKKSYQGSFEIFALVGDEMKSLGQTSNDYFLIDQSKFEYVSISEKINSSNNGPRSLAFKLSNDISNCLYDRFYISQIENGLLLNLELNSTLFIEELILEKFVSGRWTAITSLNPDLLIQTYSDINLLRGKNEYRVKILLEDGTERTTEVAEYFYIQDDEILVFPSIVKADYGIDVWMGSYRPLNFTLVNASGQLVFNEDLLSEIEYFDTTDLPQGIYFFFILDNKEIVKKGKIIIL